MKKPIFAKRHYEFLADSISKEFDLWNELSEEQKAIFSPNDVIEEFVDHLILLLKQDNPNFKEDIFNKRIGK